MLTMLAGAVCTPVRNSSRPKSRAMHRLRWTKLWSFCINSFLQKNIGEASVNNSAIDYAYTHETCLNNFWCALHKTDTAEHGNTCMVKQAG